MMVIYSLITGEIRGWLITGNIVVILIVMPALLARSYDLGLHTVVTKL